MIPGTPCGDRTRCTHKLMFPRHRSAMAQDIPSNEVLTEKKTKQFWDVFGRALRAEPKDYLTIRGSSGLDHFVEAIFVDDKSKRVIIVSAEPNPRIAALMRVDVQ